MSMVLALKVPGAILIAADSRLSFTKDGVTRRVHDDAQKILSFGGTVFAAAGSVAFDNEQVPGAYADVFRLAKSVMGTRKPVRELADEFTAAVDKPLRAALDRAYVRPAHAHREIVPGLQFFFANAYQKQPTLVWRNLLGTGSAATGIDTNRGCAGVRLARPPEHYLRPR